MKKTILIITLSILFSWKISAQFRVYPQTKIAVIKDNDTIQFEHKIGIRWVNDDASYIDHMEYIYSNDNIFSIDTEFKNTSENMTYKCEGTLNGNPCDVYCTNMTNKRIIVKFVPLDDKTYVFDIDLASAIIK